MKITLEVLKKNGASDYEIQGFKFFYKTYYKKELTPIELISEYRCFSKSIAYKCVDTLEELKEIVDWTILADWDGAEPRETLDYTFEYCLQLYKQDLKLFKKAVEHHLNNDHGVSSILDYCGEVLVLIPGLYEKVKELHEKLTEINKIRESC